MPALVLPAAAAVAMAKTDPLEILSGVVGWTYFVAWSASFYPQVILNYRRKFVGGLSIDFTILNLMGHSSYAVYNVALYFNESVREEYRRRHSGADNTVQLNDVAFSVHAATLTFIVFLQTLYYRRERDQRLSTFNRIVTSLYALVLLGNIYGLTIAHSETFLDILRVLSVFKLYVSIAKYIPQAYDNYLHQSTDGWSIENVLLDFTGGVLSFIQLFIDAGRTSDWSSIIGNPVKFGLSVLSILFSVLFIIQHFVLYTDHHDEYLSGGDIKTKLDVTIREAGGPRSASASPERTRSRGVSVSASASASGERAPLLGP